MLEEDMFKNKFLKKIILFSGSVVTFFFQIYLKQTGPI